MRFAAVEADLILRYASRPQKPDNVRAFFAAQADVNRQRALAEVAGSSKDFPLLVKRTSENFHLRSDGALVVIERFQIDLHPAVFLGTVIFQQQRRAFGLSNQQIHSTGSGNISGDDRERLGQFHGVQPGVFRSVSPIPPS